MTPTRLSILGVGLLGGSIGLAAKAAGIAARVVGYGHRPETLRRALEVGAIDESAATCQDAVRGADVVILCTPVGLFEPILTDAARGLAADTLVSDVGCSKRSVVQLAQ
jgi:prephenate dehydrogenase